MAKILEPKFKNPNVFAVFQNYSPEVKTKLIELRKLIFEVAQKTKGVGEIEETLKWGQPSYLTSQSKSGSTIRIDKIESKTYDYAMYFNCQTSLLAAAKEILQDGFAYEGNRAILFKAAQKIPIAKLRLCIALALTYHSDKKNKDSFNKIF